MLNVVRRLLQGLLVLNLVAGAGFIILAMVLGIMPERFMPGLNETFAGNGEAIRPLIIGVLLVATCIVVPVHVILRRLIAMIDTVRAGRPFSAPNVARLRHIAWGVFAIQIGDLAFGWFSLKLGEASGQLIGWQLSLTGWLSVLLLFVLARVFEQGVAMQDELEGTV